MAKKRLHVISNSHLDREHRHEFQETRIMLVDMMDNLIKIMENDSNYKYFTLDGQAIVLDDYLEVKPEKKERLKKLIKDERILIGPWYSLVDCFSVMPESIIRNLLHGHKTCRKFGDVMKLGYSIFSFGQIAQLPQIYNGFGINDIVFYKSASKDYLPQSEFIWVATDGSEALSTRLGKEARWNFYFDFSIPVILGGNPKKPGWESKFTDGTRLCHLIDDNNKDKYSTMIQPDIAIREDKIKESVQIVMKLLDESASEKVFLGFDGTDFTSPLKEIPEAIKKANKIMGNELEILHSNPVEYFKEVKEDINLNSLTKYTGEMRHGPVNRVHSETMGINPEIKQAMFNAENTLLNYAEPISSFLYINGGRYERELLELAWKYLFAAHAHDSIHGAGDPKIKPDNLNRLEQVQKIADVVTKRAIEGLVGLIDMSEFEDDDILITVFNTTTYLRSEVAKLTIDLPKNEAVEDYWLEELNGDRVETYQLARYDFNLPMIQSKYRPKSVYSDRVELCVNLKNVPPFGFKIMKLKRIKGAENTYINPFPLGYSPYDSIGKPGNILDNGLLRISCNYDGSIDVYDYETGHIAKGLNHFTDRGSSGDFWVHREPYFNEAITTKNGVATVSTTINNGLMASLKVSHVLNIPEGLNENKMERLKQMIATEIVSEITLKKGSKRVDFKTSINNKSKDHMLTVSFPTFIKAEFADWEAPFEIRKRYVDNFTNNNGKKGPELERAAMQQFIDINDGNKGLSLFTKGLKEVGTVEMDGAILNLTLLRATTSTFPIHNDLFISFENEPSQCIGNHIFEYSIYMHKDDVVSGNVIDESRKYMAPMLAAEVGSGNGGKLKSDMSFMSIDGGSTYISAVKQSENEEGLILRICNITDKVKKEKVTFTLDLEEVFKVNMNEEIVDKLQFDENKLHIEILPYKIESIYVKFKK